MVLPGLDSLMEHGLEGFEDVRGLHPMMTSKVHITCNVSKMKKSMKKSSIENSGFFTHQGTSQRG